MHDKIFWDRWKKFLCIWWIDQCMTRHINWCDSKYNRQYQIRSILFFLESFLEKILILRRGWWYLIIDNVISECTDFLIRHILQMVYQSTSSSEYLFFSFPSGFLFVNFIIMQLQLINLIITINFIITTYHTWFPALSGLKSSDIFPLVSKFLAISFFSLGAVNAGYHV